MTPLGGCHFDAVSLVAFQTSRSQEETQTVLVVDTEGQRVPLALLYGWLLAGFSQ
jgi:hypothetical protein